MRISFSPLSFSGIQTVLVARKSLSSRSTILVETSYEHDQTPVIMNRILSLIDQESQELSQKEEYDESDEAMNAEDETFRIYLYEE